MGGAVRGAPRAANSQQRSESLLAPAPRDQRCAGAHGRRGALNLPGPRRVLAGLAELGAAALPRDIVTLDPRPRRAPFVIPDCSSISPNLIASEPFGHAHPAAPPAATCASSGTTWSAASCSTSRLRPPPSARARGHRARLHVPRRQGAHERRVRAPLRHRADPLGGRQPEPRGTQGRYGPHEPPSRVPAPRPARPAPLGRRPNHSGFTRRWRRSGRRRATRRSA